MTVPTETNEDEVKAFIEKYKQIGKQSDEEEDEEEIIGDMNYSEEDALLSTKLINVDKKTVRTRKHIFLIHQVFA
ncbi:hypothetical protein M9Y10_026413 [Tritrichomonas musculus]|uniref:Uncharacterized protein n=1 Tax=Tritrichomonas musculus TaxID=1915356 RepID=A0ABR2H7G8_9EUKA